MSICGKPYVTRSAYTGFNDLEKHAKICPARNHSRLTSTSSEIGDSPISSVSNSRGLSNDQGSFEYSSCCDAALLLDSAVAEKVSSDQSGSDQLYGNFPSNTPLLANSSNTNTLRNDAPMNGLDFLPNLDTESIGKYIIQSVDHVPCHLQDLFRECCSLSLTRLAENSGDTSAWNLFLLTPRLLLQPVPRGGKSGAKEYETRSKKFSKLKFRELSESSVHQYHEPSKVIDKIQDSDSSLPSSPIKSTQFKIRGGEISRAANILSSSGLGEAPKTFQRLKEKHLARQCHISKFLKDFKPACLPLEVPFSSFVKFIKNSPNSPSCGCTGWRFEHFKLLLDFYFPYAVASCLALYPKQLQRFSWGKADCS